MALEILIYFFKNTYRCAALSRPPLELKTVHIWAFSIRDILPRVMGGSQSDIEQIAQGAAKGLGKYFEIYLMIDRLGLKNLPARKYIDGMEGRMNVTAKKYEY